MPQHDTDSPLFKLYEETITTSIPDFTTASAADMFMPENSPQPTEPFFLPLAAHHTPEKPAEAIGAAPASAEEDPADIFKSPST